MHVARDCEARTRKHDAYGGDPADDFPGLGRDLGMQIGSGGEHGQSRIERVTAPLLNNFHCSPKQASDFRIEANSGAVSINATSVTVRVIEALDGQLITKEIHEVLQVNGDGIQDIAAITMRLSARPAPPLPPMPADHVACESGRVTGR